MKKSKRGRPGSGHRRPAVADDGRVYRGRILRRGGKARRVVSVRPPGLPARRLALRRDLHPFATHINWGTGPKSLIPRGLQLALAVLADATGDERFALAAAEDFHQTVIALLDRGGWALTQREVLTWVVKFRETRKFSF